MLQRKTAVQIVGPSCSGDLSRYGQRTEIVNITLDHDLQVAAGPDGNGPFFYPINSLRSLDNDNDVSFGASHILAERRNQLSKWSAEHDDEHKGGELLLLSHEVLTTLLGYVPYAVTVRTFMKEKVRAWANEIINKHHDPHRLIEISGALLAAELDRLKRLETKQESPNDVPAELSGQTGWGDL